MDPIAFLDDAVRRIAMKQAASVEVALIAAEAVGKGVRVTTWWETTDAGVTPCWTTEVTDDVEEGTVAYVNRT